MGTCEGTVRMGPITFDMRLCTHSQELRRGRFVSKVLDDRRKEERDTVERAGDTPVHCVINMSANLYQRSTLFAI